MKLFRLLAILLLLSVSAFCTPMLVQGAASASGGTVPSYSASYSRAVVTGNCLIMAIATRQGEMQLVQDTTSGVSLAAIYGSPRPIGSWWANVFYEKVGSSEGGKKPTILISSIPGWGDALMFLNEYSGISSCSPSAVATFAGGSVTNGLFASNSLTTTSGSLGVGFIVFSTGNVSGWTSTGTLTHLQAQIEPSWGSAGYGDAITPIGTFDFSGSLSVGSNQYGFAMAVFH